MSGACRLAGFARLAVVIFIGAPIPAAVAAADLVVGPVTGSLTIDGDAGEWLDKPPSLLLRPVSGGARSGRVWLAESEDGLVVAGRVGGPAPNFPGSAAEMGGRDHVELAVGLVDDLPLPKIGWADASGPIDLSGIEDCARLEALADDRNAIADCQGWYREQVAYRRQFRRLFLRRWRLAPALVEENLARPAFAALPAAARDGLQPLAPSGTPVVRFMTPTGSGYGFEILVPWDALPPAPVLELSRLRLALDVVSAGTGGGEGPVATTTPEHRQLEEVKSMTPARLDPPRRWRLSRCGYPLESLDSAGASQMPGFFLPTAGSDVRSIFIIENPAVGDRPSTEGFSPGISPTTFFTQTLAADVAVCGPPLAVRRGETVSRLADVSISPGLKVQPVKGGWLIADGPYAGEGGRFANDDCGGCLLISLRVFFVAAAGGDPVTAFDDAWLIEDAEVASGVGHNARVILQPDLTAIDAYETDADGEHGRIAWSRVRHCYDAEAHVFRECGRWPKVAAPVGVAMPPELPNP